MLCYTISVLKKVHIVGLCKLAQNPSLRALKFTPQFKSMAIDSTYTLGSLVVWLLHPLMEGRFVCTPYPCSRLFNGERERNLERLSYNLKCAEEEIRSRARAFAFASAKAFYYAGSNSRYAMLTCSTTSAACSVPVASRSGSKLAAAVVSALVSAVSEISIMVKPKVFNLPSTFVDGMVQTFISLCISSSSTVPYFQSGITPGLVPVRACVSVIVALVILAKSTDLIDRSAQEAMDWECTCVSSPALSTVSMIVERRISFKLLIDISTSVSGSIIGSFSEKSLGGSTSTTMDEDILMVTASGDSQPTFIEEEIVVEGSSDSPADLFA
ncbi:hypothetical protein BDF20DRAFT_835640 [Mycotypha africana]|uniref:uncharacterized protein n=1 Tax=Mycotypha africana TaxID=64632 RepID=UPI002301FD9A|nr:uncharacterized protein BDF20DRAFT_835640 [Mycotypha africana]KAI8979650.1 hypothetical protein BDF20DRAFT_835640 [Mycotypha africana]